ncbi:MAG: DUF2341 domain-containing protein [Candidatus Dojkabacteria bacterium]|nr:DUF2341 domain-containing protein [Candidatus Dojkabacteria bacterium]
MSKKSKFKISTQTIVISLVAIAAVVTPLAIYLKSQQDEPEVLGWYNSSWNYQRTISVANTSGSTLTNEDVLITLEDNPPNVSTYTLINQNKLQSDCGDLRFIDNDESTVLSYWIEGGCGSTTTQIWVRIPSLPAGGTTIYMYYDNNTATNGEQSWSGNFISISDQSSCGSGWTQFSALDGRFPLGSDTYGTTGGSTTHSHDGESTTTGVASSNYVYTGLDVNMAPRHSHNVTVTFTSNVNHMPQYTNVLYCSNSKVEDLSNNIALFNTSTVTGWTQYSALDDRFPYGATSSIGTTGGATTHTHTASWSISTVANDGQCQSGSTNVAASHSHSVSSSSVTSESNTPEYLAMVYLKMSSADTLTTEQPIYMLNTSTMPLGWERFTALDGKFPMGATSYGATGGSNTHSHTASLSTSWKSATGACYPGGTKRATAAHSHSAGVTSSVESNLPPYLTVIFAQRKDTESTTIGTEVSQNATPTAPTDLLTEGSTNPSQITDTTPEFSAIYDDPDTSDQANYYEIEVNTAIDFTGTSMWDTGQTSMTALNENSRSTDVSYAGTTLSTSTTYYWRIRFWDLGGAVSPWSSTSETATFSLNSAPTAPTDLLTEGSTNPTNVTDTTPEFSAIYDDPDTSDQANYYEIEVNTASNFSGTVMWDTGQTSMTALNENSRSPDVSYAGTSLANAKTYYWRIRFWDLQGAVSPWSSTAYFEMANSPTATSLLILDQTNPSGITLIPYFSAIYTDPNSDNSSAYQIEVNTASDFSGTTMWDSTKISATITSGNRSSDITYDGSALSYDETTYYVRMKFWDTSDNGSDWITGYFTTGITIRFKFEGLNINGIQLD